MVTNHFTDSVLRYHVAIRSSLLYNLCSVNTSVKCVSSSPDPHSREWDKEGGWGGKPRVANSGWRRAMPSAGSGGPPAVWWVLGKWRPATCLFEVCDQCYPIPCCSILPLDKINAFRLHIFSYICIETFPSWPPPHTHMHSHTSHTPCIHGHAPGRNPQKICRIQTPKWRFTILCASLGQLPSLLSVGRSAEITPCSPDASPKMANQISDRSISGTPRHWWAVGWFGAQYWPWPGPLICTDLHRGFSHDASGREGKKNPIDVGWQPWHDSPPGLLQLQSAGLGLLP